jgi:CO/xanthine dehydrogenase Mo-binding subunit
VRRDGGAYTTLSPVVLSRGVIHATGPYRCENVRVRGRAVKTNTPPNGAFRGFGAPQTQFAIEAHLDRIAETVGIDPLKLRERNALRAGDVTATGQRMGRDTSALAVLRAAILKSDYRAKRKRLGKKNDPERGIGLALFFHGSGFTGSGESKLASRATLELSRRGVRIHVGSSEIGQGTRTMLAQMVAETLRWPLSKVEVANVDTAAVPDSGPTVASRTCLIVGGILVRAAKRLRAKLGAKSPREYFAAHPAAEPLVITEEYRKPPEIEWDDVNYRGSAYAAYAFGCNVAEIALDRATGEVKVEKLTAVLDIGCAVNPVLVRGQIEGGVVQGVGYALDEEVVMENGRMKNGQLTNYLIPTTLDAPEMDVVIVERPSRLAPFGAKGVGEAPIDGPASAIVNALRHAGVDIRRIPATPERVLEAIERSAR